MRGARSGRINTARAYVRTEVTGAPADDGDVTA
jgi:hypothetical protein